MQRVRRRFWTWVVSGAAALVLTAAVASGLFQLAVQAVPGYRDDIERYVREVTGRPVRIGGLALTWRYYYPSIDLTDVALLSSDGSVSLLAAERLRLGFGPMRLLSGDFVPNRLELHGLALEMRLDRNGRLQVEGLETGASAGESSEVLRQLAEFAQIRLVRCRLNLIDERAADTVWSFGVVSAELARGLLGTELDAELTLPASVGDSMRLRASIDGDPLEPPTWSGAWQAELSGLTAGSWLTPYLAPGARVQLTAAEASVNGDVEQGRITRLDIGIQSGPARARRAQHTAGFDALDAQARVAFTVDGWSMDVTRLVLKRGERRWPEADMRIVYARPEGGEPVLDAHAGYLQLGDITPWLRMIREPGALTALQGAGGELHDLTLQVQGGGADLRYRLRSRFRNLSLSPTGRAAGFSGASGEVAADEGGGRVLLQEQPLNVEVPGLLVAPVVPLESFDGELEWIRRTEGWLLKSSQFRWRLWTTRGSGQLELMLPDAAGRSPEIALTAQFQADDVTAAKPLMPRAWGPGLIDWLDRSIVSGRAPSATLTLKGALSDFPFEGRPGVFSLDIQAEDALLAYQPDWPPVEQVDAQLRFRGNSLTIEGTRGTIAGNPIRKVTAKFADFSTAELTVDGRVEGETARFYEFLSRSPLRSTLEGLLARTTARGQSAVDVNLKIPVRRARETSVAGRVRLEGVDLKYRNLPEPIRDLRGELAFSGQGVGAGRVEGRWHGMPLDIVLEPQPDNRTLIAGTFRMPVDPAGKGASGLIPEWIRTRLRGASGWRAELTIGGQGETPLTLKSDLVGTEVRMPPPLGKPEAEPVPLTLTFGEDRKSPLKIGVEYQDRLGADLRLGSSGGEWRVDSGAIRLGPGAPIEATQPGIFLGGGLAELDLEQWLSQARGPGLEGQVSRFNGADLAITRATWGRYTFPEGRYQWTPQSKGWRLALGGTVGAGEVRWSDVNRGLLTVRLDRLTLAAGDAKPAGDEPPSDPAEWPLIDVDVGKLILGPANLGHVVLSTHRTSNGQQIRELRVEGGVLKFNGEGEWRRRSGKSDASLKFEASSTDVGAVMRAFSYTANLDARKASAKGALTWGPAAQGLELARADGTISLEFENGQLRAVEPGAGRVLGLVNFYALPRRLTLNFRDVVSSGLGFDRIRGDFTLAGGHAHTQNLNVEGPSLRMDLRGRIGLVDRDYDQIVRVYPDVSAGVTLGALALGGPVAGALALIAQEILDKPLDQVTQLSYRVTGSWDNPQVERVSGGVEPQRAEDRPSGPPSKQR